VRLCAVCVKVFDTEPAAPTLGPLLGQDTAVVSLQNGVDNEEKLALEVGQDHVLGGAAFIFAGIAAPGVIVHTGGPTSITFGELDGQVSERAQRLVAEVAAVAEADGSPVPRPPSSGP
jgi:2-dehydropantoate 2-reductase